MLMLSYENTYPLSMGVACMVADGSPRVSLKDGNWVQTAEWLCLTGHNIKRPFLYSSNQLAPLYTS